MRQVALIVLLAAMGSYVPAQACRLGPIDAIHTRIGAADDLANAQSHLHGRDDRGGGHLHRATEQSLVLMDEIGRGTSTFDGLALAAAIARQLHDRNRAFTLFATHYFELTSLRLRHGKRATCMSRGRDGHDIVFLHEIEAGPANRSYGVQVARLAGMPAAAAPAPRGAISASWRRKARPAARRAISSHSPPRRRRLTPRRIPCSTACVTWIPIRAVAPRSARHSLPVEAGVRMKPGSLGPALACGLLCFGLNSLVPAQDPVPRSFSFAVIGDTPY